MLKIVTFWILGKEGSQAGESLVCFGCLELLLPCHVANFAEQELWVAS